MRSGSGFVILMVSFASSLSAFAAEEGAPTTQTRPDHLQSAQMHHGSPDGAPETPALPDGMSLDEVLERASQPPPEDFPEVVPDDVLRYFVLFDQLEYRLQGGGQDVLGWEGQAWLGYDYDRLWLKFEGESVFAPSIEGESETDLLYSRLIVPFWNVQAGVQYANEWEEGQYSDRWSGVLALQGLAPGMFELDVSLYISQHGDFTAQIEGEYDLRITQRLVVQPRTELGFSAQDVDELDVGAGMTGADFDVRLRYEIKREVAPYVGFRYRLLVGETADLVEASGGDRDAFFFVTGLRLAF